MPTVTILDAMTMLAQSWRQVSEIAIADCFTNAGISADNQCGSIQDNDDPFKQLIETLGQLMELDADLVANGTTAENFVDVQLTTSISLLDKDEPILAEFINHSENVIDEQSDDENGALKTDSRYSSLV